MLPVTSAVGPSLSDVGKKLKGQAQHGLRVLPSTVRVNSFTLRHRPGCWPPRPPDQDGKLVLTQDDIDQELCFSGLNVSCASVGGELVPLTGHS